MKSFFTILVLSLNSLVVFAQEKISLKSISGKTIYCVKITNSYKSAKTTTSFNKSYSCLFKIVFNKTDSYQKFENVTEEIKPSMSSGKYLLGNENIILTDRSNNTTNYNVDFYNGEYITLKSSKPNEGTDTFFCFIY
jgi:hypothetical protein